MKLDPLGITTPVGGSREADATSEKPKAGGVQGKTPIDPEKLRLAREFEEIFIRKMLSSLEKSGHAEGGASKAPGGGDAYSSMVVSAMAQAVSQGGGIGLAEVIARSATEQAAIQDVAKTRPAGDAAATPRAATPATSTPPASINAHAIAAPAPSGPTYARPAPTQIDNENEHIQQLLKDSKP